jgi:hypothetical protein
LGNTLVTKQTGEGGKPIDTLLLVEKFEIAQEKYFAILMGEGLNIIAQDKYWVRGRLYSR